MTASFFLSQGWSSDLTLSVIFGRPLWRHYEENSCSGFSKHRALDSACLGIGTMCPVLYDLELLAFVPENESCIQMPSLLCFLSSHIRPLLL